MLRIIGLVTVVVSMIVLALGRNAIPAAKDSIALGYDFNTAGFLVGGIVTMIAGATLAFLGRLRRKRVRSR